MNVTVNADKPQRSVTDVLIYSDPDRKYVRTQGISAVVKYKAVYSDETCTRNGCTLPQRI